MGANNGGPNGTHAGVILEACARLVIGKPKNEEKPFEIAARQRDGANPFRLHVTKHHEALRLMFWKCPGHVLELANVGVKDELEIRAETQSEPASLSTRDDGALARPTGIEPVFPP